jgi:Ca2+-binding RTX toxin-like protein
MATISGTPGADVLYGTGNDLMIGGLGGDTYFPRGGTGAVPRTYVIDDQGGDAATDVIVVELYHARKYIDLDTYSPSAYDGIGLGGHAGWAELVRTGDDLVMHTPFKPSAWRVTGHGTVDITIAGQYTPGGQIEVMRWFTTDYLIAMGSTGTAANEVFAGYDVADAFVLGDGSNLAWLNGGDDTATGGAGSDIVFGGAGNDLIRLLGGSSNTAYGGDGDDSLSGGSGADKLLAGAGNDQLTGAGGNDQLDGETGDDNLVAGSGVDMVVGGGGNDTLSGGKGGDTYQFDDWKSGAETGWGHDIIRDAGDLGADKLEFYGFSGPSYTGPPAMSRFSLDRVGDAMVLLIDGGAMSITVEGQCSAANSGVIETIEFFNGYWTRWSVQLKSVDHDNVGDERVGGTYNEIIMGSDAADQIYGNAGLNLIWLGAGADTLIYKESDPSTGGLSSGGGDVADSIVDFNAAEDVMNFSEIIGIQMADLLVAQGASGVTIDWNSGDPSVSNIHIELRGVLLADLSAANFVLI